MSLGSLLQRSGEREPARTVLVPIYASFDEGLGTADLRRARALLEELASCLFKELPGKQAVAEGRARRRIVDLGLN